MATVLLTRRSKQDVISYTPKSDYDSRKMEVTDEQAATIARIDKEYQLLNEWMATIYNLNTSARNYVDVAFPKELENVKKVEKATGSKEGTTKRVRSGSVGDAKSSGGAV